MKLKTFLALALACCTFAFATAKPELAKTIKFDAPPKALKADVMDALQNRKSAQGFTEKVVSYKEIGNILWAANGINRPETGHRTAPSALNKQDVDLYVFTTQAAYKYDPKAHAMNLVVEGDNRALFTERMKTPVIILLVTDVSKFDRGPEADRILMGAADAGLVSENISIYCAGAKIDTRVRASMDKAGLQKLLGLSEKQIPLLNHAVGYEK
ncbi:Nitroreductase [Fibrobacter sp. UWH5]|uniref:nitroreductase family protein n=1 Tax=Fibrobacter sp. UWH5 TaxID=1896211 RepID=UPI0009180CC3|nr:nitroreductase family protein [Fibrobacter sp. UWH5]SHK97413.1 Nitroreductase [Fibrobacter sp. UWH5]